MYEFGHGVKQDNATALKMYQKAVDRGCPKAKDYALLLESKLRKQLQSSDPSPARTCANCGVVEAGGGTLKSCSRCKAVVYCGKECQMQHWKKAGGHKVVCK